MKPLYSKYSQLREPIIVHSYTLRSAIRVVFLVMAYLTVLTVFSSFSCSSPVPTPPTATSTPHRRPPTRTPSPTLHPPVTLMEPKDDACIDCGSEITLCWDCPYNLEPDEYYQVRLWTKEQDLSFYHREERLPLSSRMLSLLPGEYTWAVSVARSLEDKYEQVSEESQWYHFHIAPPSPIVHSISPTGTIKGTPMPVLISGENFTQSVALTIGVPLLPTLVDSNTIRTAIPMTLKVGNYPVLVHDSRGKGESSAFFIVEEPPTPKPVVRPWNPETPVPAAGPGYDPNEGCVVTSCAPKPQLDEPANGAEFRSGTGIKLMWRWDYCLPPEWKFAIRISDTYPPGSYHYEDNPDLVSCQDGKTTGHYSVPEEFTNTPGTYYWNIAVARSVGEAWKWERLSENSEIRSFTVKQQEGGNGPDRPDH